MTLIVPRDNDQFISYNHQKEIMKKASDQGVYMRISTEISSKISFILTSIETGEVTFQDDREVFNVEFVSPHFNPWDEIFDLQEDGSWKLKFFWRISDIDGVLSGGFSKKLE